MTARADLLLSAVDYARRAPGSSPFVGITAGNGAGTIMVRRAILKGSLKGLDVIDAEVHDKPGEVKALILHARGEHVKARRVFYVQNVHSYAARMEIEKWKEERAKREARPKVKVTAREKQIQKLQQQRAKLGTLNRPRNPCIPYVYEHSEESWKHVREGWLIWHLQKPARREIMRIARAKWKNTMELYKLLAGVQAWQWKYAQESNQWTSELVQEAVTVQRWSDLKKHARDKVGGDLDGYLKALWQFCGMAKKPWKERADDEDWPNRYGYWLEGLHARKELDSMIAALQVEAEP